MIQTKLVICCANFESNSNYILAECTIVAIRAIYLYKITILGMSEFRKNILQNTLYSDRVKSISVIDSSRYKINDGAICVPLLHSFNFIRLVAGIGNTINCVAKQHISIDIKYLPIPLNILALVLQCVHCITMTNWRVINCFENKSITVMVMKSAETWVNYIIQRNLFDFYKSYLNSMPIFLSVTYFFEYLLYDYIYHCVIFCDFTLQCIYYFIKPSLYFTNYYNRYNRQANL